MLTELLKNAFRATVENHYSTSSSSAIPPVRITISAPTKVRPSDPAYLSMRLRDQGGGVPPSFLPRIFSYAFTTAGRLASSSSSSTTGGSGWHDEYDEGGGGGPYAAQHMGGAAAIGGSVEGGANLFGEITGKGLQTGLGSIAGLGYGLPMSKLYAQYFGGSLDLLSVDGWGEGLHLSQP